MKQSFFESVQQVINETHSLLLTLNLEGVSKWLHFIDSLRAKRRIFFWARGRSFLILRGFAMRLMHMGYEVHIVGEVDCPSIDKEDVLVVASGSGSTGSILLFAEKAKKIGATVAAIIGKPETPLHHFCDLVVEFHPEMTPESQQLSANGGGTRFEHSLMLFFDGCILNLVYDKRDLAYQEMMKRHANLE
jgi:6-phospho-3-hexuloisomerase